MEGNAKVIAVTGKGGVGKTSLRRDGTQAYAEISRRKDPGD